MRSGWAAKFAACHGTVVGQDSTNVGRLKNGMNTKRVDRVSGARVGGVTEEGQSRGERDKGANKKQKTSSGREF